MTYALVALSHATYGGVYYTPDFTVSGTQPVWTKLTTTGLPSTTPQVFRVDYGNPIDIQYLGFGVIQPDPPSGGTIYGRNGGDWALIMSAAIASAVVGVTIDAIAWLWTDPYNYGTVFTTAVNYIDTVNSDNYVLKSTDYGATWAVMGNVLDRQTFLKYLNVRDDYIWGGYGQKIGAFSVVAGSRNGGVNWDQESNSSGLFWPPIAIDPTNPARCYCYVPGNEIDYMTINGAGVISRTIKGGPASGSTQPDFMFIDPINAGYAVNSEGDDIFYTEDSFTSSTLVNLDISGGTIQAITDLWNIHDGSLVFAVNDSGGQVYYLSSKTDTTASNRSGANSNVAPYTDSIPNLGSIIEYGVWAGMPSADKGIYVYSVEEGDITNIPDADNLGLPLFGDRSSWRDFDADEDGDGTPLADYHAQDIKEDTPQRHAPWPASSGQAPVSDGTKWVPTDIITQAEFDYSFYLPTGHCPVTLDADAALILDLQGGCTPAQEIGLDTQQPTYVFIGPSFMPPDEPTFRPMYIEELANVTTTAPVLDGEVLTFDGGIGEWVNEAPVTKHNRTVTTLTAGSYTLDNTYDVVVLDATAGDIEITIPPTSSNDGLEYAFKRIDDTENLVSIIVTDPTLLDSDGEILTDSDGEILTDSGGGAGDTIDGDTVQYLDSQYLAIQIVADADGSAWWII